MATVYGLTPAGFVGKPQSQILAEIQTALKQTFGANINLGPESNFGQLAGIFSEREALIWQLAEAVYASQYPGGAEGTSVDNILALNNLRRLLATPTRTNPAPLTQSNGITLYGLVLFGSAGTVIPAGSIIQNTAAPPLSFTLDSAVTIQAAVNDQQSIFMSNTPTQGSFSLAIIDPAGNTMTTALMPWNILAAITQIGFSAVPVAGNFKIVLTQAGVVSTTANIPFSATAAQVQGAINLLAGYGAVTVTGSFASGFQINWGTIAQPLVTITANTLGVVVTPIDSVQANINNLFDATAISYPYTDAVAAATASGFVITFGAGNVAAGQPTSSQTAQALFTVASNSLQMGITVTNLNIVNEAQGAPAQGIGSATCTATGPNFVAAGSLTVIGSPQAGWSGVNNQLDGVTGTTVEDDTQALVRRQNSLQANANGPLASIVEKVRALTGVTAAIGFENLNEAALQIVSFNLAPISGSWELVVNGTPTSAIPYNATAAQVQTAIRGVSGFTATNVTGSIAAGFTVDFNGSLGGQPLPLMSVTNNTTGAVISVAFGRPGKSFEIVVQGGTNTAIAQTILDSKPAGIQTYGSTTVQVFDALGNPYNISFSRPTAVPIYVTISMTTDLLTSESPQFNPASVANIQQDIVNIGGEVSIGGLIIGFGSNGLIGAFNDVPGIVSYTMYFDRVQNPVSNANIQLQPEEVPVFETFNISVSYT